MTAADLRALADVLDRLSLAADTVFAPGDRLAIVNQDPADATLADLSITLKGSR